LDKIIGLVFAAILSGVAAVVTCYGVLSILTRLPVANSLVWWSFTSYWGLAITSGSVFAMTFGALMALYVRLLRRAMQESSHGVAGSAFEGARRQQIHFSD
jgi:formate hydrogenlyase subunit 3/multisubunit Na+/H+ antiporter MnhD subunit